jgi:citrate synthase
VTESKKGLEGVIAAKSSICSIDGEAGVLTYRGISIRELATESNFEEVIYLLWFGKLPTAVELAAWTAELQNVEPLHRPLFDLLRQIPRDAHPMARLRSGLSLLGHFDPEAESATPEANRRKAIRIQAHMAQLVPVLERLKQGKDPVEPRKDLKLAGNFLYQLTGHPPDATKERILDVCLVLHADHELNASTFSARTTAATLSDIYSALVSAVGTLKGPLHGGANEQVMQLLNEIGERSRVEAWLDAKLAAKQRIAGFGHRVYKNEDPRALELKRLSGELATHTGQRTWFDMSTHLEKLMLEKKGLRTNVDFYSASVYHVLEIPWSTFTPVFAVSRAAGWLAHVLEQYADNRLIRPRAEYIGPALTSYVPIDRR